LASHSLALVLLALLGLAVLAGGTLPQAGRVSTEEFNAWYNAWPTLAVWSSFLGLDRVFSATWFLGLNLLLLINMAAGMVVSISRRYALYKGTAPPRQRIAGRTHRPVALPPMFNAADGLEISRIKSNGAVGLLGIPLFHLGIAIIILGGIWSGWAGFGGHFELSEGRSFDGRQDRLTVDRGTTLPVEFGARLRLDRVQVEVAEGKYLRELKAHVSVQQQGGPIRQEVIETNSPLSVGSYRLYPDNTLGYSAVFERIRPDGDRRRLYINIPVGLADWDLATPVQDTTLLELEGMLLYYEMTLHPGPRPVFDLLVRQAETVLFEGRLIPGSMVDLGAYRLLFKGNVRWLGFYLTSDRPMRLVFAGFVLTLVGFLLHLLVPFRRVALVVTPEGWEVMGWVMRGDYRFNELWSCWLAQLPEAGA
jgi:cytochrome c biogenesis protein ResB